MALVVFAVVILALAIAELGPSWVRRRSTGQRREADPQPAAPAGADSGAERDETALVAELLVGAISPAQYQLLMEDLAAADARAHPLIVPGPSGSPPPG